MSQKKKYQFFISAVALLFLYIVATGVFDRWAEVFQLYDVLTVKEKSVLNPDALAEKKMNLLAERKSLGLMLTKGAAQYDQSGTGVFEYLNTNAKDAGIRFESLTPIEAQTNGQIKEIGFKLQFVAEYHRVGVFLNSMEKGVMMSCVKRIDLTSRAATSPLLQVSVEGVVNILSSK